MIPSFRLSISLALALALVSASACRSSPSLTREQEEMFELNLESGRTFFEGGHMEQAFDQYSRCLAAKPDFYEAQLALGYCAAVVGRYADGKVALDKALAQHPDDPMAHLASGMLHFEWGRAEARGADHNDELARGYSNPAVPGNDPGKAQAFAAEAARLAGTSREKLETARVALVESERLFGDRRDEFTPQKGEPVPTAGSTQKRLADNRYLLSMLALVHASLGREHYAGAIAYLDRFIAVVSQIRGDFKVWYDTQRLKMNDAQQQEAKALRSNLERSERKAQVMAAWLCYAQTATLKGPALESAQNSALAHLDAALALDPDSPNQHINRARILAQQKKYNDAVAELSAFSFKNLHGDEELSAGAQDAIGKLVAESSGIPR